jgi:LacI family transcriptional regulator
VVRDDHFRRTEPFYTGVYLGTEFEANNNNLYVLLSTVSNAYKAGEDTPRFLRERNVDGILVAGRVPDAFIEEASDAGLPLVLIDFEYKSLPAAMIDNIGGARTAVQHLIEKGHRRIAFLGADMSHPSLSSRREGFQLACAEAGVSPDDLQFAVTDNGSADYDSGLVLAQKLLDARDRPTAVFCVNDSTARSVLDHAIRLRLEVPGDLAIVGFDDVPQARHTLPGLTTVRVQTEQLGEVAMRYLVDLVHDSREPRFERGAHRIIVPTKLMIRDTT